MRLPVTNNRIGDKFSIMFSNLRCFGDLSKKQAYQNNHSDILSIWECIETGNKFAYYNISGITQITQRLYDKCRKQLFATGDIT